MSFRGGIKRLRKAVDPSSSAMDRISQLPPPTLHQILSFLSQKEAVRTCVLSKTWRYLGSTRPNFEFREEWFDGNKEKFLSVLDNNLQRYHDQNLSIQELNLEIWRLDDDSDESMNSILGKWIPIFMLDVKTFKLRLNPFSPKKIYFDMPSVVFRAKSLQELDLKRCKLTFNNNSIDNLLLLSYLRKLELCYVHISEETLEYILSSCPLIDFLALNCCELLRTINAKKARNLKHFGFHAYSENQSSTVIHVSTTLESIRTAGSPNWFFQPNYMYFPHLKCLHLISVKLSAESFDKFSSKYCPCLETLKLYSCKDFEGFQLSSRSITHLELKIWEEIKGFKAAIDVPNILYFKFSSYFVPSIYFKTTSGKWESHISVTRSKIGNDLSFHDLNKLLKALIHSRIHLELCDNKYGHIEDTDSGGSSYKPVKIEKLRFDGEFSYYSFPELLKCLLRTCRPSYIDTSSFFNHLIRARWEGGGTRPVESLCTILLEELENTSCKKDLEKCSMLVLNKNAREWCPVQVTRVPEDVWSKRPDIIFRLKWRELS